MATKRRIERKMEEMGMTWAVRSTKYIAPDDPFGSSPTWHVHPNAEYPHEENIQRFDTLNDLWEWLTTEPCLD